MSITSTSQSLRAETVAGSLQQMDGKVGTAGGDGIVLTIADDEPGFEWDFVVSKAFPDASRIENRDTHKII